MESLDFHDLTAAYALDALDADEARAYEEHLAHCERCQRELAELSGTAAALAYGTDAPEPPASLRARILDAARRERGPNIVPLRPRYAGAVRAVAGGTLVLSRRVPAGATVAVTVERRGGVNAPTTKPVLTAKI